MAIFVSNPTSVVSPSAPNEAIDPAIAEGNAGFTEELAAAMQTAGTVTPTAPPDSHGSAEEAEGKAAGLQILPAEVLKNAVGDANFAFVEGTPTSVLSAAKPASSTETADSQEALLQEASEQEQALNSQAAELAAANLAAQMATPLPSQAVIADAGNAALNGVTAASGLAASSENLTLQQTSALNAMQAAPSTGNSGGVVSAQQAIDSTVANSLPTESTSKASQLDASIQAGNSSAAPNSPGLMSASGLKTGTVASDGHAALAASSLDASSLGASTNAVKTEQTSSFPSNSGPASEATSSTNTVTTLLATSVANTAEATPVTKATLSAKPSASVDASATSVTSSASAASAASTAISTPATSADIDQATLAQPTGRTDASPQAVQANAELKSTIPDAAKAASKVENSNSPEQESAFRFDARISSSDTRTAKASLGNAAVQGASPVPQGTSPVSQGSALSSNHQLPLGFQSPVTDLETSASVAKASHSDTVSAATALESTESSPAATQSLEDLSSTFVSSLVGGPQRPVHTVMDWISLQSQERPAPVLPHEVRLDAGAVQLEIQKMVKQGGGHVVMELTPPDQSKFTIELKLDDRGGALLVVEGVSDSTRTRLEQSAPQLREQFQQMGLELQLDMRQQGQSASSGGTPFTASQDRDLSGNMSPQLGQTNANPLLTQREAGASRARETGSNQVYLYA